MTAVRRPLFVATVLVGSFLLFAILSLLPQLRNRPAVPAGLAGAAQWANQPAPDFGQPGPPAQHTGIGPPPARAGAARAVARPLRARVPGTAATDGEPQATVHKT